MAVLSLAPFPFKYRAAALLNIFVEIFLAASLIFVSVAPLLAAFWCIRLLSLLISAQSLTRTADNCISIRQIKEENLENQTSESNNEKTMLFLSKQLVF